MQGVAGLHRELRRSLLRCAGCCLLTKDAVCMVGLVLPWGGWHGHIIPPHCPLAVYLGVQACAQPGVHRYALNAPDVH